MSYIYTLKISIGYPGADHEDEIDVREDFSEEEWDSMSMPEKESYLEQCWEVWCSNFIDGGWFETNR